MGFLFNLSLAVTRHCSRASFILLTGLWLGILSSSAQATKPHEYLQSQTAPNFNPAHSLPRLTRWGWTLSYEATVELAEHWGYTLEIGGVLTRSAVSNIQNNPAGQNARLVALALSDPEKYPLSVLAYRPLLLGLNEMPPQLRDQFYVRDASGNLVIDPATGGPSGRTISPNAPDAVYQWAAAEQAAPLAMFRELAPISIILSGGEDGVHVSGHSAPYWEQDPTVLAAKGTLSWYDYASQRKGHYQQIISDATYATVPDRDLFLYYYTDGAAHRGAINQWDQWVFDYNEMQSVSDIPNSSMYYNHANTGWTGSLDLLSLTLNSMAQQIAVGDELSYNWVNGGFQEVGFSDPERYVGYLKSAYNAGMIGGVAGYFSFPVGGFNADLAGPAPSWLTQLEALGQVHATFSHLEKYLREGQLLAGPAMHKFSTDLPAYELTTADPQVRILARKLAGAQEWLVTAWAADGGERVATTQLPGHGTISVLARPAGSIYLIREAAEGTTMQLLDPAAMLPSEALNTITVSANTGSVLDFPGQNLVLDGESFTVNVTPLPNFTLTNVFVDGVPQGPLASITFGSVVDSHTLNFEVSANSDPFSNQAGDMDRDGDTDGRDFLYWQRAYGTTDANADLNGDHVVNQQDLSIWQQYVSAGPLESKATIVVPEPTWQLFLLAAMFFPGRSGGRCS